MWYIFSFLFFFQTFAVEELCQQAVNYLDGESVQKDKSKGLEFAYQAALTTDPLALNLLADIFLSGDGVEKNPPLAAILYKLAAEKGYGPSQFNLGILYRYDRGVIQNKVESYYYLCLASLNTKDLGEICETAARYRDEIAVYLTPHQRQEVLARVARYGKEHIN